MKTKLLTQTVKIPAGTVAGTYEATLLGGFVITGLDPVEMDNHFNRVSGIAFIEVQTDGLLNCIPRVSFRDATDVFINNVRTEILSCKLIPEANDRFTEVNIKGKGNIIYVKFVLPTALATDYIYDIIYKLDNEDYTTKPRIKYDAQSATIPSGASPYQQEFNMDVFYTKVTALLLQVITLPAGTDYLRLSIDDNIGEVIGNVPEAALQNATNRSLKKNFVKVEKVLAKGNKLRAKFTPVVALGAGINVDLVFKLEA